MLKICCSFYFNITFCFCSCCAFKRSARILASVASIIASYASSALSISSSYFLSFSISVLIQEKLGIRISIGAHNVAPTFLQFLHLLLNNNNSQGKHSSAHHLQNTIAKQPLQLIQLLRFL
jgi:hypothetical protein